MQVNVEGQIFDVPDDATPDEIDGLTRPKFQGATARSGAEWAMQGMSPAERKLAAFGENAAHTLKQGGNLIGNIAEGLTGHRPAVPHIGNIAENAFRKITGKPGTLPMMVDLPTDAEVEESSALNAPLNEAHPGYALAGQIAPQMLPVGGGGAAVARAGLGSRLLNVGTQAALGAGQGYVFSDPTQRGTNAALGGVVGGGVAALANPLAAVARNALKRANKGAVDLFEPGMEKLREIAEKWRKPGESIEQGIQNAGKAIRSHVDPGTGRRLVAPVEEVGERALMAERVGAQGGEMIDKTMRYADSLGLKGKPAEIRAQLIEARKQILGEAPFDKFTPTQRRALAAIDRQIQSFDDIFGTKAVGGAVNPGAIPEETALKMVDGSPIVGSSQVGASAPDTLRVFDPPYITGKVNKIDPVTKKFVKGGQVPAQPGLIPSREVEVATDAWEPWRSFVQRHASRDRLIPGTNRPRPLGRNEYMVREVTQEGVPGVGSPMQMVEFNDLPLSKFEEKAKRLFGKEGFEQAGSGRYRTAEAAEANPAVQWYRRATGITKEHVEKALPAADLPYFLEGKAKSQVGQVLGPAAETAALMKGTRSTGTGGSPQGWFFRRGVDWAKRKSRPYRVVANEKLDAIANALPHNLDADVRKALIAALRQETPDAP